MTKEWQADFINYLSQNGNVSRSALLANVSRMEVYRERAEQPDFAKAWNDALDQASDLLEEEARRRAYEGVDKPIWYKGVECGVVREYSDTLMIFLLKGAKPEKYRENIRQEVTGKNGGPVEMNHALTDLRELPADELIRRYRDALGEGGEG